MTWTRWRIGATAHYTGHVWVRNGLADRSFDTGLGRAMFSALHPLTAVARPFVGGMSLEAYLVTRHRMLDELLTRAIERDGVGQVLEVAAGLSPRGCSFTRRYPGLLYIEADLPPMVSRKRALLERAGHRAPGHRVVSLDLLAADGRDGLEQRTAELLDPARPTAIVAEGLLSYFDHETLSTLWLRIVATLRRFPSGRFLANVELESEIGAWTVVRWFVVGLGRAVGARTRLCFADADQARTELASAGFDSVELHPSASLLGRRVGPEMVRALEAVVWGA